LVQCAAAHWLAQAYQEAVKLAAQARPQRENSVFRAYPFREVVALQGQLVALWGEAVRAWSGTGAEAVRGGGARRDGATQGGTSGAGEAVERGGRVGGSGGVVPGRARGSGVWGGRGVCGHGIGKVFHGEPQGLHCGRAGAGMELQAGMTLT
ncbi:hypothetical protein B1218_35540, partial [Pseudomonas ogarae]